MRVGLAVYHQDSLTYALTSAISYGDHEIFLYSANNATNKWVTRISNRLINIPNVTILGRSEELSKLALDRLIYQFHSRLIEAPHLSFPAPGSSEAVTVISTGDKRIGYLPAIRQQLREILCFPTIFSRARKIVYKDGFYLVDLYSLFKKRSVVGFMPHSKFLDDKAYHDSIYKLNWRPEDTRSIAINFMGSQDPGRRRNVLETVRTIFESGSASCAGGRSQNPTAKELYWHEYTDETSEAALQPSEFLDVLTNSDFTLCPPGWYLLTHRPIEALLRGSVPVLNASELSLYDMDLEHGCNCIAVQDGDWKAAVEEILEFDEDRIIEMRRNVWHMQNTYLSHEVSAHRMRARIGLN